jgi:hypothetical protein
LQNIAVQLRLLGSHDRIGDEHRATSMWLRWSADEVQVAAEYAETLKAARPHRRCRNPTLAGGCRQFRISQKHHGSVLASFFSKNVPSGTALTLHLHQPRDIDADRQKLRSEDADSQVFCFPARFGENR